MKMFGMFLLLTCLMGWNLYAAAEAAVDPALAAQLKSATDEEAADLLVKRIEGIEAGQGSAEARRDAVGALVAEAMVILGDRGPAVLALMTKRLSNQVVADILVKLIAVIEAGDHSVETKKEAIATLTADLVGILGDRAPAVLALAAERLSNDAFVIVVASAVVSAPAYAVEIVQQIQTALPEDSPKQVLLKQAASNPKTVLSKNLVNAIIVSPTAARYEGQSGSGQTNRPPQKRLIGHGWRPCVCF